MSSSDCEYESDAELDLLQVVDCMFDVLMDVFDDTSSGSSDSGDDVSDWSVEVDDTENTHEMLLNDGGVNHATVTENNNALFNVDHSYESDSMEDIIDASYTLNIDQSNFKDTDDEKICNQDTPQDFSSDDASGSNSSQDFSSGKEGQSTPHLADVFNTIYELYTEFHGEESVDNQDAECSNLDFGGFLKGLLELFNRENVSDSGGKVSGSGGNVSGSGGNVSGSGENVEETEKKKDADVEPWKQWLADLICELLDFWRQLNSWEDKVTNTEMRSDVAKAAHIIDPVDENTDYKKDPSSGVTNNLDLWKELLTYALKILLWICSGCKEVAADSYEADDVLVCNDGANSINDLLRVFSNLLRDSDPLNYLDEKSNMMAFREVWKLIQWLINVFMKVLILTLTNFWCDMETFLPGLASDLQKIPSSPSLLQRTFKFIHWLNNISCEFTHTELTDTGSKQPNEVIVSCLISWICSIIKSSDTIPTINFLKFDALIVLIFFGITVYADGDQSPDRMITELKNVSEISPWFEHFLRNIMHLFFSWALCFFSKKLPFEEKTCMFGKRLVKEVSVLELLLQFMNEDAQQTPAEVTELQEIVKKLSEDFQVENIRSRFYSVQHGDNVVTQTYHDSECGSVVDLLWSRHEDALSQSNWFNAFAEVTKMIDMFVNDVWHFLIPGLDHKAGFTPVLSGSRLDGCVSMLSGPGNACDIDIMDPMLNSDNFIIECVPGHPACVVFKRQPGVSINTYQNYSICFNLDYFSPKYFNDNSIEGSQFWLVISLLFSSQFHRRLNTAISIQCGDVATTCLVFQGGEVIFSADWVPAVIINSWPEQAQSWRHRKADWPALDIRDTIARSGCHAVPKTPKGGDPHRDWRLSFSIAENTLCKMFTHSQAFHLSLLKTQFQKVKSKAGSSEVRIFKNYTIPKGEFHTYHAKTAMFWFCENHSPTHVIWRKENVFQCQSELLESIEGMMREGNIPHYFIPEQNLLEGIPAELLQQAADELHTLKEEARTESGRVYQEIIKQADQKDSFTQYLSDVCCLWKSIFCK